MTTRKGMKGKIPKIDAVSANGEVSLTTNEVDHNSGLIERDGEIIGSEEIQNFNNVSNTISEIVSSDDVVVEEGSNKKKLRK